MALIKGDAKSGDGWSGEKIFPLFEEEQRALATLVGVIVLEDKYPVRVVVQQQDSDGTWYDTSTDLTLLSAESTEQTVDGRELPRRLIVTEERT